jgi:hypothetical protein
MKKYSEFIKEESSQWVKLENIFIKKYGTFPSISLLNDKISDYIDDVYGSMGYVKNVNSIFELGGVEVDVQLMINNYTIFKRFIIENKISSASDFFNKLVENFSDVYHYDGNFFNKHTKYILSRTRSKGKTAEDLVFDKFKEFSKSKGLDIDIIEPTKEEDIEGTDGYFFYKGKKYTIQVKPGIGGLKKHFSRYKHKDGFYKMKSQGSLSLNTNFLFLYEGDKYIFIKNKKDSPIVIKSEYFIFNEDNIVYSDFSF